MSESDKLKSAKTKPANTSNIALKVEVAKEESIEEEPNIQVKPKPQKPKSIKTKPANISKVSPKVEATEKIPVEVQLSTPSIRSSPRLGGVFFGIRAHWQFILTFIVACVGTWLLVNQNVLLQNQNTLIQHQMSLEEASRRSSLVMLMSNIMDKVDREIESQQKGLSENDFKKKRYKLSQSLIGQIAALSHSFKPYRYMSGDTLISRRSSPERGQLLITLTLLPLDTSTLYEIYKSATFQEADLNFAKLIGADLSGVDLRRADLSDARLDSADLSDANLNWADLSGAILDMADLDSAELHQADLSGALLNGTHLVRTNLSMADLSKVTCWLAQLSESNLFGADLSEADLLGADLRGALLNEVNLTRAEFSIDQINKVFSLYKSIGMHDSIKAELLKTHPQLFDDPFK